MTVTVFRNATVFDGVNAQLREAASVVVEGERIREIGDSRLTAGGATEIDVGGKTLMPGLIDAHVHVFAVSMRTARDQFPSTLMTAMAIPRVRAMLDRGFTTVRDTAGADFGFREALAKGYIAGPRLFICGPGMSQTGGHGDHRSKTDSRAIDCCSSGAGFRSRIVDDPAQMRHAVRDELRKGADHIKIMASGGVGSPNDEIDNTQFTLEEMKVAVEEAAARDRYVAAHAYGNKAIRRAVTAGVRTIEHANYIDQETAEFVKQHNAFVVPTLVCYTATEREGKALGLHEFKMAKLRYINEAGLRMLEHCERAGTKMGFGTDLIGEVEHAQSDEFTIRAQVQKPIDILRSATSMNAEILQRTGQLGTVAPGALADLIVVDGNPLTNIGLLRGQGENISVIMQNGALHKNRLPARQAEKKAFAAAR